MKDNQSTTAVNIEVTTTRKDGNGRLIDEVTSGAKLTKADAGHTAYAENDSLTIKINGTASAKIDYNGSSAGTGDNTGTSRTVEVTVKEQTTDAKGEVIEPMAAGAKFTKADAGRMANETAEDWFSFQVEDKGDGSAPEITTRCSSKLTKADAGKV